MHHFLFIVFTSIVLFFSHPGNAQGSPVIDCHDRSGGVVPPKDALALIETPIQYLIFSRCDTVVESRENFMQNEILYRNDTLLIIHHWLAQSDFMETVHVYNLLVLKGDCAVEVFRFSNRDSHTFETFPYHLKVHGDFIAVHAGRKTLKETFPIDRELPDKLRSYYVQIQ